MQEGKRLPLEDRVMPEPTLPAKREHKKLSALAIIGIAAGVVLLCCAAICTAAAVRHTVYPNTTVLGVDMSGLTAAEAVEKWKMFAFWLYFLAKREVLSKNYGNNATSSLPRCDGKSELRHGFVQGESGGRRHSFSVSAAEQSDCVGFSVRFFLRFFALSSCFWARERSILWT